MRRFSVSTALALASMAAGQTPDLVVQTDLRYTVTAREGGGSVARWYDPMGRHSTVGLQLILEPGLHGLVTQRLQKIDNDPDRELLDEAYVEEPGVWRVGKQYLPFGSQSLLRESVPAMRADTRLVIDDLPIRIAVCDGGKGLTRGVVARVGRRFGVSFAVGDHFGVGGTNLTALRRPEEAPPRGTGYRVAAGVDVRQRLGRVTLEGEFIAFRRAHRASDPALDVSDLRASFTALDDRSKVTAGWARSWRASEDVYRLEGELLLERGWWLTGFVRVKNGSIRDLSVGARIKL